MVNSKKMSKSTIAVIALSILLVLSLILTATGAWFTDTDSDHKDPAINFGHVEVNVTATDSDAQGTVGGWTLAQKSVSVPTEKMMPGDRYDGNINIENVGNQKIYYKVTVSSLLYTKANYDASTGENPTETLAPIAVPTGITVTLNETARAAAVGYAAKADGATITTEAYGQLDANAKLGYDAIYALDDTTNDNYDMPLSIVLSTGIDNAQQEKQYVVVFTASVEAVQQANFVIGGESASTWPTCADYVHA